MSNNELGKDWDEAYEEFARKMQRFEDGPTTTPFEQLTIAGILLPEPEAIADDDLKAKLWEVIASLANLRVYLDETDHLSDRELYTKLWHDVLRDEVPAIDEIGFSHFVNLLSTGSERETSLYLKYYADDAWRSDFVKDHPDQVLPPREDPPFSRDCLLPRPPFEHGPEAREWLRANWSPSAFATNRFSTTDDALKFVERLYAARATDVTIENILMLPNEEWVPYADTLIVCLPEDPEWRRELLEVMERVGRPDENADGPLMDSGQSSVRLWWD
jgi:hypothetical protein